ncbi:hypothetical protein AAF712_005901 [Marasmius tenuissimus]|uniref:FAD-binding PCMH-type domain-containing protein n=1 Tax=Marasmius tenuissimus TaxID=585030 RepID=A0ABR3A160_9AGAR
MFGISHLTLLATSVLSFTFGSSGQGQDARCKCLYGDACWPTESDFTQLSSRLSQPLIHPLPPASACYPASSPSGTCTDVQVNSPNGTWRADQAGAYQNTNFEAYVFPNGSIRFPCEQGSVPPIGVDARNVGDIQAAVKFAAEKNLRLVVKNTGHDYLGRSSGRNGFMIWTHHLKNITYNETFVPEGAPATEAYQVLTLGAGVQWREGYSAAQQNNRYVVGGISGDGSVGAAGGWIGGGGHSAFSPKYGLGVDNAIQFTIVTANGDHVTTNAYSHPDLFWALRGGGAGTYGVVTSVTYKTYSIEPLVVGFITANFTSIEIAKSVGIEFLKLQPTVSDAQWGGYSAYNKENFYFLLAAPNATIDQVNATVGPFLEHLKTTAGENNTQVVVAPVPSFYDVFDQVVANAPSGSQVGHNMEIASRLYTRDLYETVPEKMVETFLNVPGGGGVAINHVSGGVVSQTDPESTGLNPAWRKSIGGLVYTIVGWPDGASAADVQAKKDLLKQHIDVLEGLEPGTGSYINEGSLYEPNSQWTYFGDHYDRLLEVKDQYDPEGLFVVASGVGSERWDDGLNCQRDQ